MSTRPYTVEAACSHSSPTSSNGVCSTCSDTEADTTRSKRKENTHTNHRLFHTVAMLKLRASVRYRLILTQERSTHGRENRFVSCEAVAWRGGGAQRVVWPTPNNPSPRTRRAPLGRHRHVTKWPPPRPSSRLTDHTSLRQGLVTFTASPQSLPTRKGNDACCATLFFLH